MKLFNNIALEDVELTGQTRSEITINSEESLDALHDDYFNMEDCFDALEVSQQIQESLGENPSESAQIIATIGMEALCHKLGIGLSSISLENDDEKTEEKSFFSKVWQAIKNFFSKIWNWIVGLFRSKKNTVEELEKIRKHDDEVCQEIVEKVGKQNTPEIRSHILNNFSEELERPTCHLKPFDYLNKAITVNDIENSLDTLLELIKESSFISKSVEQTASYIARLFTDFKGEIDDKSLTTTIGNLFESCDSYLKNSAPINHQISSLKKDEKLLSELIDHDRKKSIIHKDNPITASSRFLTGFTHGNFIHYMKIIVDETNPNLSELYMAYCRGTLSKKEKSTFDTSLSNGDVVDKMFTLKGKAARVEHELHAFINQYDIISKNLDKHQRDVQACIAVIEAKNLPDRITHNEVTKLVNILRKYNNFILSHFSTSVKTIGWIRESMLEIYNLREYIVRQHEHANKPTNR